MKKVYLIEKVVHSNEKTSMRNLEYNPFGYFTNKEKGNEFVKNGKPIELLDSNGVSYIPKRIINEYKLTEIQLIS